VVAGRFQRCGVREVPLLGLDGGEAWCRVLDLLVETAEGYWILDHKSDITDDRLLASRRICAASVLRRPDPEDVPGKPVLGVAIHWISYGKVNLLPGRVRHEREGAAEEGRKSRPR